MKKLSGIIVAAVGLLVIGAACASSGAGGRKVAITQTNAGCSPKTIAVTPGEKLNLVVKNDSSSDTYEVEGIEGTSLEEVVVRKGKTLSLGYTVPEGAGIHKIKCYVPAGVSTIMELNAGEASAAASPGAATSDASASPASGDANDAGGEADTTVTATLLEYSVTPSETSVAAGKIRFVATNDSKSEVHEFAVLKTKDDGTFENMGEIEDIKPGQGGAIVLDLKPGSYQLACLVAAGEFGSVLDHYQQGMHTEFTVQ